MKGRSVSDPNVKFQFTKSLFFLVFYIMALRLIRFIFFADFDTQESVISRYDKHVSIRFDFGKLKHKWEYRRSY